MLGGVDSNVSVARPEVIEGPRTLAHVRLSKDEKDSCTRRERRKRVRAISRSTG